MYPVGLRVGANFVVPLVVPVVAAAAAAQCAPVFSGGLARPGVDDEVLATTMWDPDGAGPLAPRLVVGGRFTTAGAVLAPSIAMFDFATATWSSLGGGLTATFNSAYVAALQVGANGELYAAGSFTHADGAPARNVARWDGAAWHALGAGCSGGAVSLVNALARLPNGDLVAGGMFALADGAPAKNIARWNGAQWSPLTTGVATVSGGIVNALLARANGTLVVGGNFTTAGGAPAAHVAAWDGAAWSPLGAGLPQPCYALAERSGQVLASSWPAEVRAWDGSTWQPFGTNPPPFADFVRRLQVLPNADVLALRAAEGIFRCAGATAPWRQVASIGTPGAVEVLAANDLVVGGRFAATAPTRIDGIGRWNGASTWLQLGDGIDGDVLAAAAVGTGHVLAGRFTRVGGVAASRVVRRDGGAFQPLGTGVDGDVTMLASHGAGHVAAAGTFTTAGGAPAPGFASWNGTAWSTLGGGPGGAGQVRALATAPNGDLLAALASGVLRRWNGTAWSTHASFSVNDYVTCMAVRPTGEVLLGGGFQTTGQSRGLMQWNGAAWQAIGSGFDAMPWSIAVAANGDLVVGGEFTHAGGAFAFRIARWNGVAWSPLGPGFDADVRTVVVLPDGDVLAGGDFRTCGLMPVPGLARWTGSLWLPAAPGVGGGVGGSQGVAGLVPLANGDHVVFGGFAAAGALPAARVALVTPGCSPTIAPIVSRCRGDAGPLVASAPQPPHVGQTFVAHASGFAPATVAFSILGFQPISLAWFSVHPVALPGCNLLASPDLVGAMLPVAGVATTALAIPAQPSVVGLGLYVQFAGLQWSPSGVLASLLVSNGLVVSIEP